MGVVFDVIIGCSLMCSVVLNQSEINCLFVFVSFQVNALEKLKDETEDVKPTKRKRNSSKKEEKANKQERRKAMIKEEVFVIKDNEISPLRAKSASSDSSTPSTPITRTLPTNLSPRSTALAAGMHDYVPTNPVKAALHKRLSSQDLTPSMDSANRSVLNAGDNQTKVAHSSSLAKLKALGSDGALDASVNSTSIGNTSNFSAAQQKGITTTSAPLAAGLISTVSSDRNVVLHMTQGSKGKQKGVRASAASAGNLITTSVITTVGQPNVTVTAAQLSQSATIGLSAAQAQKLSMLSPLDINPQGLYTSNFVNPSNSGLLDPSLTGSEPPLSPQNVTLYPSAANDSISSTSNSTAVPARGTESTSLCNSKAAGQAATSTIYTVTSPTLVAPQEKQQMFVATAGPGGSTVLQRAEAANVLVSVGRAARITPPPPPPPSTSAASIPPPPQDNKTTSVGTKSRRGRKRGSTNSPAHHIPAKVAAPAATGGKGRQSVHGSLEGAQESIISMVTNVHQPLKISAIPSPDGKVGGAGGDDGRAHHHRRHESEQRSKR